MKKSKLLKLDLCQNVKWKFEDAKFKDLVWYALIIDSRIWKAQNVGMLQPNLPTSLSRNTRVLLTQKHYRFMSQQKSLIRKSNFHPIHISSVIFPEEAKFFHATFHYTNMQMPAAKSSQSSPSAKCPLFSVFA